MNIIIRTMFIFMIIMFSCSHCGTKYLLVETVDEEQGSGIDTGDVNQGQGPVGIDQPPKIEPGSGSVPRVALWG